MKKSFLWIASNCPIQCSRISKQAKGIFGPHCHQATLGSSSSIQEVWPSRASLVLENYPRVWCKLGMMRYMATKILSKERKTETVSAPSCRWSKWSRVLNNGFNRANTLCPPPFLFRAFLPSCTVAEVICLLGIESIAAVPAQRCGIS